MNETLIKELVKMKMNTAGKIIDRLPPDISEEIKDLRRVIMESVKENIQEEKARPPKEKGSYKPVNHVIIE